MRQTSVALVALLALGLSAPLAGAGFGQSAEEELRSLFVERFARHWQAADPQALADLWHEEGDWMSATGSRRIVRGRAQIEQVWTVGLQGRDSEEERAIRVEVDAIRLLRSDLAQVDLVLVFGNERTGLIREAMVAIVSRVGPDWRILSSRVARISSVPARP